MNAKKRKNLRKTLAALTKQQLVALGKQKTDAPYQELLAASTDELVEFLLTVDGVLKPEAV